jgi:hypothetical protein
MWRPLVRVVTLPFPIIAPQQSAYAGELDLPSTQVLVILLINPINSGSQTGAYHLPASLARVVFLLKPKARKLLTALLASLPPAVLGGRAIRPLQTHLTAQVQVRPSPSLLSSCRQQVYKCVCFVGGDMQKTGSTNEILDLLPNSYQGCALIDLTLQLRHQEFDVRLLSPGM